MFRKIFSQKAGRWATQHIGEVPFEFKLDRCSYFAVAANLLQPSSMLVRCNQRLPRVRRADSRQSSQQTRCKAKTPKVYTSQTHTIKQHPRCTEAGINYNRMMKGLFAMPRASFRSFSSLRSRAYTTAQHRRDDSIDPEFREEASV